MVFSYSNVNSPFVHYGDNEEGFVKLRHKHGGCPIIHGCISGGSSWNSILETKSLVSQCISFIATTILHDTIPIARKNYMKI